MTRILVVCLPDAIIALPTSEYGTGKGSSLIPTRSFNQDVTKMPAWIYITSEELETDSEDYNQLKEKFTGYVDAKKDGTAYDDDWYMNRIQVVISAAFRNLAADPNFKDNSES